MANRITFTPKKQLEFLNELREEPNVRRASSAVGISTRTAYDHRKGDPAFAEAWDVAIDEGINSLEDEAVRRALKGSDTMLIFLLKCRRPDVYSDRARVDLTT